MLTSSGFPCLYGDIPPSLEDTDLGSPTLCSCKWVFVFTEKVVQSFREGLRDDGSFGVLLCRPVVGEGTVKAGPIHMELCLLDPVAACFKFLFITSVDADVHDVCVCVDECAMAHT